MSDSIHPTQDKAIAAAIAASVADGLGGVVIVHDRACAMSSDVIDVDCTCAPVTLQLGASA